MKTTLNPQNDVSKLVQTLESLPSIDVFHSLSDPDGYWAVYMNVTETSGGWESLKIISSTVSPTHDQRPELQFRCLTTDPVDALVFVLSPVQPDVDPLRVCACIEAQSLIRFLGIRVDDLVVA